MTDAKLKAANQRLDRVLKRIDRLHDRERALVFQDALRSRSADVCAHVEALKASRRAGLKKLKEYSSGARAPKSGSPPAAAPARKSTQPSAKRKAAASAASAPAPAPARACDDITTVNKLINCLESCCKKFDDST